MTLEDREKMHSGEQTALPYCGPASMTAGKLELARK